MRKINHLLITGAAGALGKVAREGLRGIVPRIRLSDISPMEPAREGEEVIPCDLADEAGVDALCRNVDAVLHLGGRATEAEWPVVLTANIHGVVHLWEAARRHGVDRILFASSNHAIGLYRRTTRISDRSATRPDSRYGVSKAFGEQVAELYAAKFGVRGFSMRIGSCFPEPVDQRMLSTWLSYADFLRLVQVGLAAAYSYEVVYGVSNNTRNTFWDNANAHRLGYRPQDDAEHFAGKVDGIIANNPASDLFQGGSYVAAEFGGNVDLLP